MALSLLTGFPGFIGRRLAARLLEGDADERIVAIVEERMLDTARSVAGEIDPERIEVVAGDIAEPGLGLDGEVRDRLIGEMRRVYHLAAIYNLAVPLTLAWSPESPSSRDSIWSPSATPPRSARSSERCSPAAWQGR